MTIGGRLSKADIQSSAKYQSILPGNYHAVQLFIQQYQETSYFSAEYFGLSMVECQSSRLGEDVWYVNKEKQDQMNLS